MATQTTTPKKTAASKVAKSGAGDEELYTAAPVLLSPIQIVKTRIWLVGLSPLQLHELGEKTRKGIMRDKVGVRDGNKKRELRDPIQEYISASIIVDDTFNMLDYSGTNFGFKSCGLKKAIASTKPYTNIDKVSVYRNIFIPNKYVPILSPELPKLDADVVAIGGRNKVPDIRFRPIFNEWYIPLELHHDESIFPKQTIAIMLQRAGLHIGLGEQRIDKAGTFGSFRVATDAEAKKLEARTDWVDADVAAMRKQANIDCEYTQEALIKYFGLTNKAVAVKGAA